MRTINPIHLYGLALFLTVGSSMMWAFDVEKASPAKLPGVVSEFNRESGQWQFIRGVYDEDGNPVPDQLTVFWSRGDGTWVARTHERKGDFWYSEDGQYGFRFVPRPTGFVPESLPTGWENRTYEQKQQLLEALKEQQLRWSVETVRLSANMRPCDQAYHNLQVLSRHCEDVERSLTESKPSPMQEELRKLQGVLSSLRFQYERTIDDYTMRPSERQALQIRIMQVEKRIRELGGQPY